MNAKMPKTPLSKELSLEGGDSQAPIVRVVDKLFEMALSRRASDIHLEPQEQGLFLRFRIDGGLQTIHQFPREACPAIVSRIKILAAMDIAEKRLPQDGQIRTKVRDRDIEMRISTLPGKYGEKVVIRLLDKSVAAMDLGQMGMAPKTQSQFEMIIDKPQGIILVTGPTGSGKTTTLYSVLTRLRSPLKNIITLEDPIEYELMSEADDEAGVTQVQLNPKIGLTFSAGLRASLRQDPDVIMVGEIRDKETAEVAMKAAMTGHLVLSTLHTNSAPETVGRLLDIGIDSYLIASTVISVMAQRLMRLLCETCKEAYQPPARMLQNLFPGLKTGTIPTLYRPKGCARCQDAGYCGRQGIFELMPVTDELKRLIQAEASVEELKKLAQDQGMATLRQSGLDLVCRGFTTIEEVFRNTVQ
ncbi:MAG: hypothetical protein A2992_07085 [Elusimicrobia bacterium RIFCSPLOWO2_01_FULL_59_12]|nr:MAG: hypothetical protein A2992_07085 [Elusimicrobia bacterium RIFCSPLOWO2_01_FULL_59_12]